MSPLPVMLMLFWASMGPQCTMADPASVRVCRDVSSDMLLHTVAPGCCEWGGWVGGEVPTPC